MIDRVCLCVWRGEKIMRNGNTLEKYSLRALWTFCRLTVVHNWFDVWIRTDVWNAAGRC